MTTHERLLRRVDVERYCQIGRSTIYRLMREGLFPVPIPNRAARRPLARTRAHRLAGPAPAGDRRDRPVGGDRSRLAASPGSAPRLTGPASVRVRVRHRSRVMPADAADGLPKGPPASPRRANAAVDYLNTLYQPDDRLAIVAVGRHGPDPKVEQRVVTARAATRPGYQRFLRHLNATGHDIFVSMNPIRPKPGPARRPTCSKCAASSSTWTRTAPTPSGRYSRT